MNKIAWFSEMGFDGKTSRSHRNMRTEFAWFVALDAMHHNILKLKNLPNNSYDLGIIIIPKGVEHFINFDIVGNLKRVCKKYAFMQEGPSWYFQDLSINNSFWFYNIMINSDFVLAHNDRDKEYYKGLLNKKCYINPTLMIEDSIKNLPLIEKNNTIIGGNLRRWYGGFNSLIVAQEFNTDIWAPQMGRMRDEEKQLEDLNHLPYMEWIDWMYALNKFKYAIHLNPNSIGGTFSLNCAYLGLPCIGNVHSNTQRLCFPDLSIEPDNLKDAKKLAKKLRVDKDFYIHCSNTAKELYNKHFSENTYNKVWKEILNKINNEN